MNLQEARKIQWLDSYPRSVGELFDTGYLNRSRLEWAVQKARDPNLREAAGILLEVLERQSSEKTAASQPPVVKTEQKPFPLSIPLSQARNTLWPYSRLKGQTMGDLIDSKQLSLKDLAYAVETAWDSRVRQAAIALLVLKLEQAITEPAPSAGPVHVIDSGRSYAEGKQLQLMLIEGLIMGMTLGAMVIIGIVGIAEQRRMRPVTHSIAEITSTPTGIIALLIFLAFAALIVWLEIVVPDKLIKRLDKQVEEYRLGQEGEDRVVELVVQALDGNWSLFRNVSVPGRNRGDLDLVLVGPPGVWVLEVKNYRGQYRNVGDTWEYFQGSAWKRASSNPSQQAKKNALRLKDFLGADNLKLFVNNAVVWANPESPLSVENPTVAVWLYDDLPDELGNIWQGEKLAEPERAKIIGKLSKLCEAQKNQS